MQVFPQDVCQVYPFCGFGERDNRFLRSREISTVDAVRVVVMVVTVMTVVMVVIVTVMVVVVVVTVISGGLSNEAKSVVRENEKFGGI